MRSAVGVPARIIEGKGDKMGHEKTDKNPPGTAEKERRMQLPTHKRLMIFSGTANRALADEVAAHLGMKLGSVEIAEFANSETYVRFNDSVRGCDAFVIQSHCAPVDHHLMQQLHHDRRPQACVGEAHHGRLAVLSLRTPGQEDPRRASRSPPS